MKSNKLVLLNSIFLGSLLQNIPDEGSCAKYPQVVKPDFSADERKMLKVLSGKEKKKFLKTLNEKYKI